MQFERDWTVGGPFYEGVGVLADPVRCSSKCRKERYCETSTSLHFDEMSCKLDGAREIDLWSDYIHAPFELLTRPWYETSEDVPPIIMPAIPGKLPKFKKKK